MRDFVVSRHAACLVGLVFIATIVAAVPKVSVNGVAADDRNQRPLVGLRQVGLLVDALSPEALQDGLSRDTLSTDVEAELRRAGITISQPPLPPGAAYLRVTVIMRRHIDVRMYAVYVEVSLHQLVVPSGKDTSMVDALTWRTNSVGIVGAGNITEASDVVRELVREFTQDLRAANSIR
jgi:hypothetical protein